MKKFLLLAATLVAQPALANDFSGLRAEVRVGYETPTVSGLGDGKVYKLGNSASIGGEFGYDVPVSEKVNLGPFINADYANAKDCGAGLCLGSGGNLLVGGRVGLAVADAAEVYFKLGYDQFKLKASALGAEGSKSLGGVGGELGLNYKIGRKFYVGASLNYADLGEFAGLNFQRRHVSLHIGSRF